MGCRFFAQEIGYRELQRHCHIASQLLPFHPTPPIVYDWDNRASIHHGADPQHPQAQENNSEILRS
jgi:hypothetical protein